MDNTPIHIHVNIEAYIESRGYKRVYLPSYSPELNPIEYFWSVAKSKLKRENVNSSVLHDERIAGIKVFSFFINGNNQVDKDWFQAKMIEWVICPNFAILCSYQTSHFFSNTA
jgi:hypothetical protein